MSEFKPILVYSDYFPNGMTDEEFVKFFQLLSPGTVQFTAVLEIGDDHEIYTITSDPFTVTQP